MIKNIVFDVGYVLVDYTWGLKFMELGYNRDGVRELAVKIFGDKWAEPEWHLYDLGEVSDEEVHAYYFEKYPQDRTAIAWFFNNPGKWVKYMEDMVGLFAELKEKGYGIYLLSNYPETLFYIHVVRAWWYKYVDGQLVSYETHYGKPEIRFYEEFLRRNGLHGKECVFLDDLPDNTEAAKMVEMSVLSVDTPQNREAAIMYLRSLPKIC